jgi:hypothetical protein
MKPMTAQQVAQYQREQQAKMQRAAEAEIRPSGSFKVANGGFFQMEYPSNWDVMGQSNSGVTIAPRAGVSENAIAYGVVVGGIPAQGGSLENVTRGLVQSLQQQNPNLQVQGARQISVNGAPAMSVGLLSPSPLTASNGQPVAEQDTLVTIQRSDGAVVYAVFVAPQQDMPALNDTYTRMLQSLRVE